MEQDKEKVGKKMTTRQKRKALGTRHIRKEERNKNYYRRKALRNGKPEEYYLGAK